MSGEILVTAARCGRDWMDWATLIGTFSGVVVVAWYTIIARRQSRLTADAVTEAKRSNKATEESNKLTSESNRTQREAFIATNRARLSMPYALEGIPLTAGTWRLPISIVRTGLCPALNVIGRSGFVLEPEELTEVVPVPNQRAMISIAVMLSSGIGPDIGKGHSLTAPEVRAIKEGRLFLYCVGLFTYEDGMESDRKRLDVWLVYDATAQAFVLAPFGQCAT